MKCGICGSKIHDNKDIKWKKDLALCPDCFGKNFNKNQEENKN